MDVMPRLFFNDRSALKQPSVIDSSMPFNSLMSNCDIV